MIHVETVVEPPGLDHLTEDDGDPYICVHAALIEADGTRRAGYAGVPADATDAELVDALVACVRGVAAMRGPGLVAAVEGRLR